MRDKDASEGCNWEMSVLSAVTRVGTLAMLTLSALGCQAGLSSRTAGAGSESFDDVSLSVISHAAEDRRREQLDTRLHPIARALIDAQDGRERWIREAAVALSSDSCMLAVRVAPEAALGCSLLSLGDSGAALLIMRAQNDCENDECFEQSWVFLHDHREPLPLPARHISDYRSLRAELSQEHANALWLAGFRSASSGGMHAAYGPEGEDEPAQLAAYSSCTLAPDGSELVCRSTAGDVLAFDPRSGSPHLVARLGIPARDLVPIARHELTPVWWTADGRLAMRTSVAHHPLCGDGPCELVGFARWPAAGLEVAQLVRAEP